MAKSVGTQDRELRKRRMAVAAALLAFAGIVGVLALLFGRDALAFLTDGHREHRKEKEDREIASHSARPARSVRQQIPRHTPGGHS